MARPCPQTVAQTVSPTGFLASEDGAEADLPGAG